MGKNVAIGVRLEDQGDELQVILYQLKLRLAPGVRAYVPEGLTRIGRNGLDDPVIVETWL